MSKNPFLEPENFYDGYQESINNLKNNPESVELELLCYRVYSTEDGKKLLNEFVNRFVMPGFVHPNSPNIKDAAIYFEGFKEAFRMMRNCVLSHEQRIKAESLKQAESKQQ